MNEIKDLIYDIESEEVIEQIDELYMVNINNYIEPTFYDRYEFHKYHSKFAEDVYRLIIKNGKKIIGYCYAGVRNNMVTAPYSAPFSMIYTKDNCRVKDMCEITKGLIKITKYLNYPKFRIMLPPEIYNKENINLIYSSLNNSGFKVSSIDINNYFNLSTYTDINGYLQKIDRKSRQNYNRAVTNGLRFMKIENEDFIEAYDVIKRSKEELDYPLKISAEQMKDIIDMESSNVSCFLVKKDDEDIAAAIAFDITKDISQIIYVGDSVKYRNLRPTELLYTGLIQYFKEQGKRYIDLGPSGENGITNIGLADFKKSMGCNNVIKLCFELNVDL